MKRLLPVATVLSLVSTAPHTIDNTERVTFTADQALYLVSAHISGTIISPSDGTIIRLTVSNVEDGVAVVGVSVWTGGRAATEGQVATVARSMETKILALLRITAQSAGLERYVKGVKVIPVEGSVF